MRYNTVLFDADGTLLDFHRSEREAVGETFKDFGIDADDEKIRIYSEINDGLWKMLERKEIEKSVLLYRRFELFCERYGYDADAKAMAVRYRERLGTKGYLLDGARELCERLFGKVKMYIVTNGVEAVQMGRYEACGLSHLFDGIFISDTVGCEKPDVRFFDYVEAHVEGFDKKSAIIVGDSLSSDMKGGVAYGIDTCWYCPDGKSAPLDMPLTYVARSHNEIFDILTKE